MKEKEAPMKNEPFAKVVRTEDEVDWDYFGRECEGMADMVREGKSYFTAEEMLGIMARPLGFEIKLERAERERRMREAGNVINMVEWLELRYELD